MNFTDQNINKPRCYSYIRFSTPEQLKGNSLSRQLDLSKEYAKEHGLYLDESFTMQDLGLSAYSGEHIKRGALGLFLNMVKTGKVPKDSVLLVESLDRISREQVLDAFDLFRDIIRNGIRIVTLADGIEYSESTLNANIGQLMISLTIMSRAYEESLQKSKRIAAAWENKRKHINEKKLTRTCPGWLNYDENNQDFKKNKERCKIVERIFNLSLDGNGIKRIAKIFNLEKIPSWKKNTGWYDSYVYRILTNRAVLGEFQPRKHINKKREPVGEPIPDYYPRIISDNLFYQVQDRLKSSASKGGKIATLRNLFGGLTECAYCGSRMQFVNKGKSQKGGTYLVCDSARRGLGCKYISFRYQDFETAVLTFCSGLNVEDILLGDDNQIESEIALLQAEATKIVGELGLSEDKIRNLGQSLEGEGHRDVQNLIKSNLAAAFDSQQELKKRKEEIDKRINEIRNSKQGAKAHLNALKELLNFFENEKGDKLLNARLKLRAELRQIIDKIVVYPAGHIMSDKTIKFAVESETKWLKSERPEITEDELTFEINRFETQLQERKLHKNLRSFVIYFKNGNYRVVIPDIDDLSKFIVKAEKDGSSILIENKPVNSLSTKN